MFLTVIHESTVITDPDTMIDDYLQLMARLHEELIDII